MNHNQSRTWPKQSLFGKLNFRPIWCGIISHWLPCKSNNQPLLKMSLSRPCDETQGLLKFMHINFVQKLWMIEHFLWKNEHANYSVLGEVGPHNVQTIVLLINQWTFCPQEKLRFPEDHFLDHGTEQQQWTGEQWGSGWVSQHDSVQKGKAAIFSWHVLCVCVRMRVRNSWSVYLTMSSTRMAQPCWGLKKIFSDSIFILPTFLRTNKHTLLQTRIVLLLTCLRMN